MLKKWLRARAERKHKEKEAREEAVARFETELLNPHFGVIEEVYGKPISKALARPLRGHR